MRKFLLVVILLWFCIGRGALIANPQYKNGKSLNSKKHFFQVGHINEFVLDQGHPFKKPSVFGYATIQQGKLKEFILDNGYPSKKKPGQTLTSFKIIGEY